ncbi:MAG: Rieske 2Fe-2S domain-containing protein [Proteobacteria bacterium]|nr:Rieske 2Fe-2S domain-containing protein [Pseudomonadota bacterium]
MAYGALCTHLACVVHWKDEDGCAMHMGDQIDCVCHAGHFEVLTGKVIAGPPPSPLAEDEPGGKRGRSFCHTVG